jgi:hypothetical protein
MLPGKMKMTWFRNKTSYFLSHPILLDDLDLMKRKRKSYHTLSFFSSFFLKKIIIIIIIIL